MMIILRLCEHKKQYTGYVFFTKCDFAKIVGGLRADKANLNAYLAFPIIIMRIHNVTSS